MRKKNKKLLKSFIKRFIIIVLLIALGDNFTQRSWLIALPNHLQDLYKTNYSYLSFLDREEYFSRGKIRLTNRILKREYAVSGKPILVQIFREHKNKKKELMATYTNLSDSLGEVIFEFVAPKQDGVYQIASHFLHSVHRYKEHTNFLSYRVISRFAFIFYLLIAFLSPAFFIFYSYFYWRYKTSRTIGLDQHQNDANHFSFNFSFLIKASPLITKMFFPHNNLSLYYRNFFFWREFFYEMLGLTILTVGLLYFKIFFFILISGIIFSLYRLLFRDYLALKILRTLLPYLFFLIILFIFLENYGETFIFLELLKNQWFILGLVLSLLIIPYPLFMLSGSLLLGLSMNFYWTVSLMVICSSIMVFGGQIWLISSGKWR